MSRPAPILSWLLRAVATVATVAVLGGANVGVGGALPAEAAAQEVSLDAVDALAQAGRADEARSILTRWMDGAERNATRRDLQRSLWLRAVLTVDPTQAALDLRRLVVEHPGGAWSDQALLRLGQLSAARGEMAAAAASFRTLLRDYPGSPTRLTARQWMQENGERVTEAEAEARARESRPDATSRAAVAAGIDPAASGGVAPRSDATPPPSGTDHPPDSAASPEPVPPDTLGREGAARGVRSPVTPPAGDFTVQIGAFASAERARNLLADLAAAGFEPRIVALPGSDLLRVRVGRFTDPESATRQYDRIRAKGFEAAVVAGAAEELPPEEMRDG